MFLFIKNVFLFILHEKIHLLTILTKYIIFKFAFLTLQLKYNRKNYNNIKHTKRVFESVITIFFKSIFCSEKYQNNNFFIFKNLFLTLTNQYNPK